MPAAKPSSQPSEADGNNSPSNINDLGGRLHNDDDDDERPGNENGGSIAAGKGPLVDQVITYDVEDKVELDKANKSLSTSSSASSSPCPSESGEQNGVGEDEGEKTIVSFSDDDPANPYNWPRAKKLYVAVTSILMVMNSTIGSSLPSGATTETKAYFHVENDELLVLTNSVYLIGYVLGPLIFAPLSESYGRKVIITGTFVTFTAFTLGCALANSFASLIVFRLFVGISASTPLTVIGGVFADIYYSQTARGLAITLFMAATMWGPLVGPVASGYLSVYSWRWTYWFALIVAGVSWPLLLFMPETYGPVILKRRAQTLRKKTGNDTIFAPVELQKNDLRELIVVVLTRPFRMMLFEAVVWTACLYLGVAYGIFYIYFQAYPIVFGGIYGFSPGEQGLAFIPLGIGACSAAAFYLLWDKYLMKAKAKSPPPAWTQIEEYVRLPLACFGGPIFAASLFWLGWAAQPDVHWIVPVLSGLPFGFGYMLIFMGELNYVVDAYGIFAASAMAATTCARSAFCVVLPFAAQPMYARLGVAWGCSLLGFLSMLMALIPFVFIRFGDKIRARSEFCQELQRKRAEAEEEQRQRQASLQSRQGMETEDLEKQA